jgi:phosphotransferase system enzyme I (PtsP)
MSGAPDDVGIGAGRQTPMRRRTDAPSAGSISARRLLSRLRDLMAGSGTAQERLDKIVSLIAAEMVA